MIEKLELEDLEIIKKAGSLFDKYRKTNVKLNIKQDLLSINLASITIDLSNKKEEIINGK